MVSAALALLLGGTLYLDTAGPLDRFTPVMALFAASGGATAAVLALLVARLDADARAGWIGAALGCYSLVAIPAATVAVLGASPPGPVGTVSSLVHCMVVALLLAALVAPAGMTATRIGLIAVGGLATIGAAGAAAAVAPSALGAVTGWTPLRVAVGVLWVLVALTLGVVAVRRQEWPLWCVSGGVAILGGAYAARAWLASSPVADLGLSLSAARLLAVALVLTGTARWTQEALARLNGEYAAQEEELRLAQIRLDRTAELDHELRNGLAGLAGATSLLRTERPDAADVSVLETAVASELSRLDDLLRSRIDLPRSAPSTAYVVAPILNDLVALRSSSGMDVRLEITPGLRARGSSSRLVQVMTNLLANAERHAPGSPVVISADREAGQIVIHVRDFGPGVSPDHENAVFERGERGWGSSGCGLGLHICRSLLAVEGGSISIRPYSPDLPGCTVEVRLPAADTPARAWSRQPVTSTVS